MNVEYANLSSLIHSLNLTGKETFDVTLQSDGDDKRLLIIKSLLQNEATYLQRITSILTKTFSNLDHDFSGIIRSPTATKDQVAYLLHHFPMIFTLHLELHRKLLGETHLQDRIGVILFEFFSQSKLLDIYENYVVRISKCLSIAKLIEQKSSGKNDSLRNLRHVIISPIQRFPQMSLALRDIFSNTGDDHEDKIYLFKSLSLVRSITGHLDRRRRNYEFRDIKNMSWLLSKLKLDFSSTKLLSTDSMFELRGNFPAPGKVIKIPYNLMLCDRNVIMLPNESTQLELSARVVFSYDIRCVDFQSYTVPKFADKSLSENCGNVKYLYQSIPGTKPGDLIVEDYFKIFHDLSFLFSVEENLRQLNFQYPEISATVTKSLVELDSRLKEKERDLNHQMCSIVMIKCPNSRERKLILFESATQANEWRVAFNRTKLLSETQLEIDWLYYSVGSNFEKFSPSELPLVFQPYSINNSSSVVVKCQPVIVVLGQKVSRCLWLCLDNGWIIILHFDYRQWQVIESFQLDENRPISALCDVTEIDRDSKQFTDSELWMASGNRVFIYSLICNRNSDIKTELVFPTEIKSMCTVNGVVLVALKSNIIEVYCKTGNANWARVSDISLESFRRPTEEIKSLVYGQSFVYTVYEKMVIVLEVSGCGVLSIKNKFESERKIIALSTTSDGVWMTFEKENSIIFYDKFLNIIYKDIALPERFLSFPPMGSVTSILADEKYIWLGTENGSIMCIAIVDSLYCVDSNIPIYYSSICSNEAITELMPFQNVQSILAKGGFRDVVDSPSDALQIDQTNLDEVGIIDLIEEDTSDETDALSYRSLQSVHNNWKNSTLTLILALGTGISKHVNTTLNYHQRSEIETAARGQSTIFTFFE